MRTEQTCSQTHTRNVTDTIAQHWSSPERCPGGTTRRWLGKIATVGALSSGHRTKREEKCFFGLPQKIRGKTSKKKGKNDSRMGFRGTLFSGAGRKLHIFQFFAISGWRCETYPKDPAVLKILRLSKFTMHSRFTIAQWFASFSLVLQASLLSKRVHNVVHMGGVVKTFQRSSSLSRNVV